MPKISIHRNSTGGGRYSSTMRARLAFTPEELKRCTGYETALPSSRATLRRMPDRDPGWFEVQFDNKAGKSKVGSSQKVPGLITFSTTTYGLRNDAALGCTPVAAEYHGQRLRFQVPAHFLPQGKNVNVTNMEAAVAGLAKPADPLSGIRAAVSLLNEEIGKLNSEHEVTLSIKSGDYDPEHQQPGPPKLVATVTKTETIE